MRSLALNKSSRNQRSRSKSVPRDEESVCTENSSSSKPSNVFKKNASLRNLRKDSLSRVRRNGLSLENLTSEMRSDSTVVLAAIHQNPLALEFASEKLQNDRKIVKAAVIQDGLALEFASTKLQGDSKIVLAAVSQNGKALCHAETKLTKKKNIVLAAVRSKGTALQHAPKVFRSDKKIVMAAVASEGLALEYASEELKDDKEVVLAAVTNEGRALKYASQNMRDDGRIVIVAVQECPTQFVLTDHFLVCYVEEQDFPQAQNYTTSMDEVFSGVPKQSNEAPKEHASALFDSLSTDDELDQCIALKQVDAKKNVMPKDDALVGAPNESNAAQEIDVPKESNAARQGDALADVPKESNPAEQEDALVDVPNESNKAELNDMKLDECVADISIEVELYSDSFESVPSMEEQLKENPKMGAKRLLPLSKNANEDQPVDGVQEAREEVENDSREKEESGECVSDERVQEDSNEQEKAPFDFAMYTKDLDKDFAKYGREFLDYSRVAEADFSEYSSRVLLQLASSLQGVVDCVAGDECSGSNPSENSTLSFNSHIVV